MKEELIPRPTYTDKLVSLKDKKIIKVLTEIKKMWEINYLKRI